MPRFDIAVVDEAGISAEEVSDFAGAAEEYIGQWLAAFWPEVQGSTVRMTDSTSSTGEVQLVLAPTISHAGTLGYHDDNASGLPVGIVELEACRQSNWSWQIAASHELAEMLVNPQLDRYARISGYDRRYPIEIADPVTSESFLVGQVPMSNFTTPAFWNLASGNRYDAMGLVHSPLPTIPSKGWLEWAENHSGQWQWANAWGAELTPGMIAYMRDRQGRRFRLRQQVPS